MKFKVMLQIIFSFLLVGAVGVCELSQKESHLIHAVAEHIEKGHLNGALQMLSREKDQKDFFPSMLTYLAHLDHPWISKDHLKDQYVFLKKLKYLWTILEFQRLRRDKSLASLVIEERDHDYFLHALAFHNDDVEKFYKTLKYRHKIKLDDEAERMFLNAIKFRDELRKSWYLKPITSWGPRILSHRGVQFSSDGNLLFAVEKHGLTIWNVKAKNRPTIHSEPGHVHAGVMSAAISYDERTIIVGEKEKFSIIRLDDKFSHHSCLHVLFKDVPNETILVRAVQFHPQKNVLAMGINNYIGLYRYYDPARKDLSIVAEIDEQFSEIVALTFSHDGRSLVAAEKNGSIKRWHISENGEVYVDPISLVNTGGISSLSFNADGKRLISGYTNGNLLFWKLASNDTKILRTVHNGPINAIAMHPSGDFLATASDDGYVKFLDLRNSDNPKVVAASPDGKSKVNTIAFSPDGQYLVSGSEKNGMTMWKFKSEPSLHHIYLDAAEGEK